jgi:hypothetical protein
MSQSTESAYNSCPAGQIIDEQTTRIKFSDVVTMMQKKSTQMPNGKLRERFLHNQTAKKINQFLELYPIDEDFGYIWLCHNGSMCQSDEMHIMHLKSLKASLKRILMHSSNLQFMVNTVDPTKNRDYFKLSPNDIASLNATIQAEIKNITGLLEDHRQLMGHFID